MKSGNELFGQRIRELREEQELTQEKLAELVGVEYQTINRIENGIYFTSYTNLEKLARIFNVNVQDLFDYKHNREKRILLGEIMHYLKHSEKKELEFIYKMIRAFAQYK